MWLADQFEDLLEGVNETWDALENGSLDYEKNQRMAASRGYDVETGLDTSAAAEEYRASVASTFESAEQAMKQGIQTGLPSMDTLGATEQAVKQSLQTRLPSTQQSTVPEYMQQVAAAAANAAVAQAPRSGDIVINLSNEVGGSTVARHQYRYSQAEVERRGQNMY